MNHLYFSPGNYNQDFFRPTVEYILSTQQDDGLIPWFAGGHADPWDHVEAAMGLSVGGEWAAAQRAYLWLRDQQLEDGSWWAAYKDGRAREVGRRETNFVAYVATGVWHHYLISKNKDFVTLMWPTVRRAIEFVVQLQTSEGEVLWAVDACGAPKDDALVTGCSSIYKSLECAINLASLLDERQLAQQWQVTRQRLLHALRYKPERFDRTWASKARYSMDWFYPVLTGVVPKASALEHLNARWDVFVEEQMGCRCVSDQPWVTIAESCELCLALLCAGDRSRAQQLYSWLHQWRLDDGSYWTGYQFAEDLLWPDEKPTWTAGVVLLAADALTQHTQAANLFVQHQSAVEDRSTSRMRVGSQSIV